MQDATPKKLLTVKQAAELLHVTEKTIRRAVTNTNEVQYCDSV